MLSVIMVVFMLPQIVFAAWWNPLSWFDNWNFLLSERESETEILEQRVAELEDKLLEEKTTEENLTKEEVVSETSEEASVKNTEPIAPSEPDVSLIVAAYYQETALGPISSSIDLFRAYSTELNRYIQGIPEVANNLETMVLIGFDGDADGLIDFIDTWEDDYLRDFQDLKNIVDGYIQEVEEQKNLLIRVSGDLRTKYIPLSQESKYSQEIDTYHNQIDVWIEDIKTAQSRLTNRFIEEKDYMNEAVYEASVNRVSVSIPSLPTYSPPPPSISSYKPPITTYCDNYGNSISCTSYSW